MIKIKKEFNDYINSTKTKPLFFTGDALAILQQIPDNSIDCCITSPPYWNKREYDGGGLGLEESSEDYIENLSKVLMEVYRVLKDTGSLWLNIGDSYHKKSLMNIPWRVAINLTNNGYILRNTIIWNKLKGAPDNSKDKLRNIYEPIFHFVKKQKYFYNIDSCRNIPKSALSRTGKVISATGVSGVKYRKKIQASLVLSDSEKQAALLALDNILEDIKNGRLEDFRMVIRGEGRVTHSDSEKLSGRAKELKEKGFYFLKYHPGGSKPSDIWEIIPEDTQGRKKHFAPFPEELCVRPLKLTVPYKGVVLDPFCGTGTTNLSAYKMGHKSIGIDLSSSYLKIANNRIDQCTVEDNLFEENK